MALTQYIVSTLYSFVKHPLIRMKVCNKLSEVKGHYYGDDFLIEFRVSRSYMLKTGSVLRCSQSLNMDKYEVNFDNF